MTGHVVRVCHFTSVHPANDIRIFLKECKFIAQAGFETTLVYAGRDQGLRSGVQVKGVKRASGRLGRIAVTAWKVYRLAKAQRADIYHFHDPELLPYGVLLRMNGKRVIYDAHENVPEDILSKEWLLPHMRIAISIIFGVFENWASRRMTRVIAATPAIRERFITAGCDAIDINNYPILGELSTVKDNLYRGKTVCFVGVISDIRGAMEMVTAIAGTDCALELAGEFSSESLRDSLALLPGWARVVERGQVGRGEVAEIMARSMAGLVLFHPGPNHTDAQPNKMFEYMSAGLPVIASNFPLWREIVEGNDCGICVDPLDPYAIAKAITWLCEHPEEAQTMGINGKRAVAEKYNWEQESKKLLDLYRGML